MMCNKSRLAVVALGLISFVNSARPSLGAATTYLSIRDNDMLATPSLPNSTAEFNAFTANLSSYGIENVENINTGAPTFGFDPQLTFVGTSITANTNPTGFLSTTAAVAPPFAGFTIGSKALVESDALGLFDPNAPPIPTSDTVFTFNQHISAFGVFVIQGGDGPANDNRTTFRLIDTATNQTVDDVVVSPLGPNWGSNNVFFLGVTDTVPFDRVQIMEKTDATDGMLYDNLVAGFAVPEPGSVMLMLFGGALSVCRRSRCRGR